MAQALILGHAITLKCNLALHYLLFAADFVSGSVPNTLSQKEEVIPNPIV